PPGLKNPRPEIARFVPFLSGRSLKTTFQDALWAGASGLHPTAHPWANTLDSAYRGVPARLLTGHPGDGTLTRAGAGCGWTKRVDRGQTDELTKGTDSQD